MEADLIMQAIEGHLAPLVLGAGGKLEVCGTPEDTLEMMAVGPANWRAILQWGGEDAAGQHGSEALMDLKVVVQAAKGFKLGKGDDVYKARSGDRINFIRVCSLIRGWVRQILFVPPDDITAGHPTIQSCTGAVPKGTKWMAGGLEELVPVREAILSFEIRFAIDAVEAVPVAVAVI